MKYHVIYLSENESFEVRSFSTEEEAGDFLAEGSKLGGLIIEGRKLTTLSERRRWDEQPVAEGHPRFIVELGDTGTALVFDKEPDAYVAQDVARRLALEHIRVHGLVGVVNLDESGVVDTHVSQTHVDRALREREKND